jgi:diguanylate cyclase (GGDEF)-like protein
MMIDVDNFKRINDEYGHASGDAVLKQLAEIINSNTRSTDIVARLGGDEFVVVLPRTSYEIVLKVAQRIKQAIEDKSFVFDSYAIKTTISIGIVITTQPIQTNCFLKNADESLYKAKEIKNAIVVYE